MRIGLDSNVILYAEGFNDLRRQEVAQSVVARLRHHHLSWSLQAAGEVFNVLRRKLGRSAEQANAVVSTWQGYVERQPETRTETFEAARQLAVAHGFQIWDAIILAASAEAGCWLLLSEDMQDGFAWRGVTVTNPFAATPHPLLADALRP